MWAMMITEEQEKTHQECSQCNLCKLGWSLNFKFKNVFISPPKTVYIHTTINYTKY